MAETQSMEEAGARNTEGQERSLGIGHARDNDLTAPEEVGVERECSRPQQSDSNEYSDAGLDLSGLMRSTPLRMQQTRRNARQR